MLLADKYSFPPLRSSGASRTPPQSKQTPTRREAIHPHQLFGECHLSAGSVLKAGGFKKEPEMKPAFRELRHLKESS